MNLQNFIYLLFGLVWLSGLIWAILVAVLSNIEDDKKDEIRDIS
jgi:hypothetical protein